MPLIVSQLEVGLKNAFAAQLQPPQTAQQLALAYDSYCKAGLAGGIPPLFTGAEVKALEGILLGAIASPMGAAATFAAAWASGVQAYWLAPPVAFTAPPIAGVTTGMPGAAAITSALTAGFSNIANTEDTIAKLMSTVLDTATKTVLVTFATPPPPAGPPPPATVV